MAHITHMQPGVEKGTVQEICGKENSIFSEACSHCIVTSDFPVAVKRELIHPAEWVGGQDWRGIRDSFYCC